MSKVNDKDVSDSSSATDPEPDESITDLLNSGILDSPLPDNEPDDQVPPSSKDDVGPDASTQDNEPDEDTKSEKRVADAQRKMHEALEKVKELEKQLQSTQKPEPQKKDPIEEIAEKYQKLFSDLDSTDSDYNKQVVHLMAQQAAEISDYTTKHQSDAKVQEQELKRQVDEKVSGRLKKEHLEAFKDEFYELASVLPPTIKSLDEGIDWGVERVKKLIGKVYKFIDPKAPDNPDSFALPQSKGKSSSPSKPDEDEKDDPSIGDMIKQIRKDRVLKP